MTVLSSFLPFFPGSTRRPFHFIFPAIPILLVPLEFGGVIYLRAIKKDGVYTHVTKKFSDTCMP
jgi:hypothetical protein